MQALTLGSLAAVAFAEHYDHKVTTEEVRLQCCSPLYSCLKSSVPHSEVCTDTAYD